jgi:hypothetical protein
MSEETPASRLTLDIDRFYATSGCPDRYSEDRKMEPVVSCIEFGAADAGKAQAFLGQLFGWSFHPMCRMPE